MKRTIKLKFALSFILVSLLLVGTSSCKKSKVRKDIAGTWTLNEVTINGTAYAGTVEGTLEFKNCTGGENRKGECQIIQDLTTNGQNETNELRYRILKKGERMLYDDSEVAVSIDGDNLTMTFDESNDVVVWKLTRQ